MKRKILVAAREKKGWDQQALADHVYPQVSKITVSNWECAKKTPRPYYKGELCRVLDFDDPKVLLKIDYTDEDAGEDRNASAEAALEEKQDSVSPLPEEELHEGVIVDDQSLLATITPVSVPSSSSLVQPYVTALHHFIVSDPARHFWQIAHTDYAVPNEMTTAIQAAIKEMNMVTGDNITRRDALCELASIPMIALGKTHTLKASCYEEMLRFCTAALEGCWELYRGSDLIGVQRAFDCVCTYMPLLETIAHDSSRLRYQALDLATRYALLQWLLGWECMYPWEVVSYAQNALSLSKEMGNISLQLSAHTKLSWNYLISRSYTDAWKTMQEGEHALTSYQREKRGPSLPSGMIGNFYSGYARAQVYNGIDPDTALGIATNSEPLSGQVTFVSFGASVQSCEAAWTCNAKGDSKQAMEWLEKAIDPNTFAPRIHASQSTSGQVGTMNLLTSALLQSKDRDMKHIIRAWTVGMEGAQALKNEIKYQEAMTNFAIMRSLWSGEDAIRRLMPLTSHW